MVEPVKALAGLCLLWTGCFYLDPLNKPPNLRVTCELTDGRRCDSDSDVVRGDRIRLHMLVSDPDGNEDATSYGWKAFACDANAGSLCKQELDAQHYDERDKLGLEFEVPAMLPASVRSISVDFEARDDRGGVAQQSLVFHVTDAPGSTGERGRADAPTPTTEAASDADAVTAPASARM